VRVSVILPAVLSAAEGTYEAVSVFAFGEKLPVPLLLQLPPVATVTVPFKGAFGEVEQIVWSEPAFTVGAGVTVMIIWSCTALHVPLPVVTRVSVTVVAAISAAEAV
jgi:hypothetical protein